MDPSKPESFNHRTEKLSTGRKYHFVDQIPENYNPETNITLLLVHGFPDLWFGWRYQIAPWVKAGYRVVAPDMLGYGGTDKPKDTAEYSPKKLSDDLAAILDLIDVQKAVVIGHDWGSFIVGRFVLWHPKRLHALIQLSIPYSPPSTVYRTLEQLVEVIPGFGYQLYFADHSSTKEVEDNIDTFFNLMLRAPGAGVPIRFTPKGALRPLIIGEEKWDQTKPLLVSDSDKKYIISQFDTMHGPLSYYRTGKYRFDEENAVKLSGVINPDLPFLFIRGTKDPTCPPGSEERVRELVPQAKTVAVEAGHWLMLEVKEKLVEEVLTWLTELNSKPKL